VDKFEETVTTESERPLSRETEREPPDAEEEGVLNGEKYHMALELVGNVEDRGRGGGGAGGVWEGTIRKGKEKPNSWERRRWLEEGVGQIERGFIGGKCVEIRLGA